MGGQLPCLPWAVLAGPVGGPRGPRDPGGIQPLLPEAFLALPPTGSGLTWTGGPGRGIGSSQPACLQGLEEYLRGREFRPPLILDEATARELQP